MRRMLFILALLVAGAPALAQPSGFSWKLNDKDAPADPSRASKDGFGVLMLLTAKYQAFLDAWNGPTPPHLSITEVVTREQPVNAMLLFSGCRPAPDGNCNVMAKITVLAPNGSRYGDILEAQAWGGPPTPQYVMQLAKISLGFKLEPEDSLGIYTLKATVTDEVAGTTLQVEKAVAAKQSE